MFLVANKKKEIDNIRRTPFEFALIKFQITITFYFVHYIGKFNLGVNETRRTKTKP